MLDSGLAGRVCLVTGAAHGIGLACARLLAGEGAWLAVADRDESALQAADLGADVLRVAGDLSQRSDVERVLGAVRERHGRLDVLIHCAGIYRIASLPDVTDEEWDQVIDVNLRSSFLLAQGAVAMMQEHGDGRIVLFGSLAARNGGVRAGPPYAASKGGVEGLAKHLAAYAGPLGIRVNCVHPGFTRTAMTDMLDADAHAAAEAGASLRRSASAEEQATMAVVLASDLASFVHGATIDVNGGIYMA